MKKVKKIKLFDEIYSGYYSAIYHIINRLLEKDYTEKEFWKLVREISSEYAFTESHVIIEKMIKEKLLHDEKETEEQPFFVRKDLKNEKVIESSLKNIRELPLSGVEKMWLKSICSDPRIRLFTSDIPDLNDIESLFDRNDFILFDQYADGDPFEDENYIRTFQKLLKGVRNQSRLKVKFKSNNRGNGNSEEQSVMHTIDPDYIEYSERDDKFRLIGERVDKKFEREEILISSIDFCEEVELTDSDGMIIYDNRKLENVRPNVIIQLIDDNNALERFLLNFSHYEKEANSLEEDKVYRIKVYYDDEKDFLIRLLSFGPNIKVVEPESFVIKIREKLIQQKELSAYKRIFLKSTV